MVFIDLQIPTIMITLLLNGFEKMYNKSVSVVDQLPQSRYLKRVSTTQKPLK